MAKRKISQAKNFALEAAKLAAERHCTDITVLDLNKISPAADYFVIVTDSRVIRCSAGPVMSRADGFCWIMLT